MIDSPVVLSIEARKTAHIHLTIPRSQIQHVMGPALQELMSTLAAQGITPAGPWFTHHVAMSPDTFDFEVSVPVAADVQRAGRVVPGVQRAAKVARTIYHGPYEGLGDAWGQFMGALAALGLKTAPDLWETYLTSPHDGSDPATWQTELTRPLVE